MEPLETKMVELQTQLKTYFDKAAEEQKTLGTWREETKSTIAALQTQLDAVDKKLTERQTATAPNIKSLAQVFEENDDVKRLLRDGKGTAHVKLMRKDCPELFDRIEHKTTITSSAVGTATSGVLQIDRIPGITLEARQVLTIRDLLPARPTTMQVIDFVKVNTPMSIASPQTEGAAKAENAVTFTSVSEKVQTIATWIPASRQVLDDMTELAGFINSTLPYYVNLEEEMQLLSGTGSGTDLHGLIPQATSFNTGLLSNTAGWNTIDIVGRAIEQITAAKEVQPTFVVLHPNDWWNMRLTKDGFGRYILGDPQQMVRQTVFGLDVVPTTTIASGTFLVGSGQSQCVELRDRMEMQVDISTEHSTYFTQNLVAIRAEKRMALIVKRPASYITGTFTTSP